MSLCPICSTWGGRLHRPLNHHSACPILQAAEEIVARSGEIDDADCHTSCVQQDSEAGRFERTRLIQEIITDRLAIFEAHRPAQERS